MSQALAVAPQVTIDPIELPNISIKVSVDFDGNVTMNQPYVAVGVGESTTITWTLESELPDVFWDIPAVTMFGEGITLDIEEPSALQRRITWHNNDAAKQKRSFFYRLHVLQKVGSTFRPLSFDPIVHNDPPV